MINRYKMIKSDSGVSFAAKLTCEEIKDFFEERYMVEVRSVSRIKTLSTDVVAFKIIGNYNHSGFNNVDFDGVFYAYDGYYEFRSLVEGLKGTHVCDWKTFMHKKFGKEYLNLISD